MREFNEQRITDAVVERFQGTPDPRLKAVMTSSVHHLHGFVRDVEPTFDEWTHAIDFLTRTGQMCTDTRQEFILLSGTLGVSMLADAIKHRLPEGATQTTVLSPFCVQDPPELPHGGDVPRGLTGEPLFVEGSDASAGGTPLVDAVVATWQFDEDGYYDVQRPDLDQPTLWARLRADAHGRSFFWSILPSLYSIPQDGPVGQMPRANKRHPYRPAHVHFMISAPGHETLVTHVFAEWDPYLGSDAVFGVKEALTREFTREAPGVGPDGRGLDVPWRSFSYDFGLKRRPQATVRAINA